MIELSECYTRVSETEEEAYQQIYEIILDRKHHDQKAMNNLLLIVGGILILEFVVVMIMNFTGFDRDMLNKVIMGLAIANCAMIGVWIMRLLKLVTNGKIYKKTIDKLQRRALDDPFKTLAELIREQQEVVDRMNQKKQI